MQKSASIQYYINWIRKVVNGFEFFVNVIAKIDQA